jgi:hypothetical protein
MLVVALAGFEATASAGCIAPTLTLNPSTAVPGSAITVSGTGFIVECTDTVPPGTSQVPPPVQPATGIQVFFVQAGTETLLTTTDADSNRAFLVTVQVPPTASPGPATVTARTPGPTGTSTSASLTVAQAQPAPEAPSVQPKSLPHTGGLPPLMLAVVALVLGLFLCHASRTLERVRHRY